MHQYEVYSTDDITNCSGVPIERVIVNRCKHCGKIQFNKIKLTPDSYWR